MAIELCINRLKLVSEQSAAVSAYRVQGALFIWFFPCCKEHYGDIQASSANQMVASAVM